MSESGKSTAADYLRTRHGYACVKIGYLIESAAQRSGIEDPYQCDPTTRAELLIDSLDRYCAAHQFLDRVSVESLHDYAATVELRKLLGDALTVLYINTSASVRAARGTAGPLDVEERDAIKHQRGAAAIASIADRTIDNDGGRLALARQLDLLTLMRAWKVRRPRIAPISHLGLPVHLESYLAVLLDRVTSELPLLELLAVTGSGARGKYQHGWSDLDVFAIAPISAVARLRVILRELMAELEGVKLGLTLVTPEECAAGAVPSRILHVLTLIGAGQIVPLWCSPEFAVPAPDLATDVQESLRDGIQAAVEVRRQLVRDVLDLRSLYKVTALLAKIMLRFEGIECPGDADAIAHLLAHHASDEAKRLHLDARWDQTSAERVAHTVLSAWLAIMPALGDPA